jgi:hypothetical protein
MAKNRKAKGKVDHQPLLIGATETEAGLEWLNSLSEDQFRDRVLVELFRRMQAEGQIEHFENIHGRNDKGVDFLITFTSIFGMTIRGIQAKSKRMTRSESSGALSAVRTRGECEAAMMHSFHFQGRAIRLEGIDVWCSAPMTDDAEGELNPPHGQQRIGIKKAREILSLVEKFCPTLLTKVPQFAIAKYISDCRNPPAKSVRILGCNLNPGVHFIEPFFSSEAPTSVNRLSSRKGALLPKKEKIPLSTIISDPNHAIIFAPPLSGRTYLLEHIKYQVAQLGKICVLFKSEDIPKGESKIENLIAQALGFASPKQVKELQQGTGVVLLVDDIDKLSSEMREKLFGADRGLLRIIGTARTLTTPPSVKSYHFSGVDWLSIVRFLRALDNKLASGKPFVDRAKVFIDRTFQSSALPKNPFTIAVMLEECQRSVGKFNTPTMGRLIGRFIELQLGSHADTIYVVDFETKREFLTRLAGHVQFRFPIKQFERLLGKFIDAKGHPHSITDFSNDLLHTGVFERTGDYVEWAHPVIKEFFWVKNLVSKKELGPIQRRLEKELDTTLAALAGSQLEDAGQLLANLLPRLQKIKLPTFDQFVNLPELAISLSKLISDEQEEILLADLESEAVFKATTDVDTTFSNSEPQPSDKPRSAELSPEQRQALKKRLESLVKITAEAELHVAFNVASLILNARDTSKSYKEQAVDAVLTAGQKVASFTKEIVSAIVEKPRKVEFLSSWLSIVILCSFVDEMLGDPHLISIFRSRLKQSKELTRTLALLDLLLCCGEDEHERILTELKKANHLGVTLAFYWRVAMLYFFRFHRDVDRAALRKLLSGIRKMEQEVELPQFV